MNNFAIFLHSYKHHCSSRMIGLRHNRLARIASKSSADNVGTPGTDILFSVSGNIHWMKSWVCSIALSSKSQMSRRYLPWQSGPVPLRKSTRLIQDSVINSSKQQVSSIFLIIRQNCSSHSQLVKIHLSLWSELGTSCVQMFVGFTRIGSFDASRQITSGVKCDDLITSKAVVNKNNKRRSLISLKSTKPRLLHLSSHQLYPSRGPLVL